VVNINVDGTESVVTGSVDNFFVLGKKPNKNQNSNHPPSAEELIGSSLNARHWLDLSRDDQCAFQHVSGGGNDLKVKRYLPHAMISDITDSYLLGNDQPEVPVRIEKGKRYVS